jgi:hypothetical protein
MPASGSTMSFMAYSFMHFVILARLHVDATLLR